jgi:hypothetical protein
MNALDNHCCSAMALQQSNVKVKINSATFSLHPTTRPELSNDAMNTANPATIGATVNSKQNQSAGTRSAQKAQVAVEKPFSVRGFTSLLLVLCMMMLLASGLALYVAPRGRVANFTSWTALSLSRQQWAAVHINASILFGVVTSTHLVMNWSRLVGYMKKRAKPEIHMKRELASAVAVACVIIAGTVLELPPISIPVEFKYDLRDAWEQRIEPIANQYTPGHQVHLAPSELPNPSLHKSNRNSVDTQPLAHGLIAPADRDLYTR